MSNPKETLLAVEGMSCSSCVRHVEGALRTLAGVEKVEVRLRSGEVRVEHDPSASMQEMVEALGEAGYAAWPASVRESSSPL